MMPKINSMEVCHLVKQDEALKDVFIILLTAKGQDFDQREKTGRSQYLYD